MIAAHWDSGIRIQEYIEQQVNKRLERYDYLKKYIYDKVVMNHKEIV